MTRKIEEHREPRPKPSQTEVHPSGKKKRKPRGALFHSDDPTLAGRLEDEVYRSER